MTTSSTHDALQHYLSSVTTNTLPEKKTQKAKRSIYSNALSEKTKQNGDNNKDVPVTAIIVERETYIKSQMTTLTIEERKFLLALFHRSKHHMLTMEPTLDIMSYQLCISKMKLKKFINNLITKQIISIEEHIWQGKLIVLDTICKLLLAEHITFQTIIPTLTETTLMTTQCVLPFETQFVFMMSVLEQADLQLNQSGQLYKVQSEDIKAKILAINPLLSVFSQFSNQMRQRDLQQSQMLNVSDDEVVNFIIELAYHLQFISKLKNKISWDHTNWSAWLAQPNDIKRTCLKVAICEWMKLNYTFELSYDVIKFLAVPQNWVHMNGQVDALQKQRLNVAHFVQSLGWVDVLVLPDNGIALRSKTVKTTTTEPIVLSQLMVLCFEDCSQHFIWHINRFAQIERFSEVLTFQFSSTSILSALQKGYEIEHIEQLLGVTRDEAYVKQWTRLKVLAFNQLSEKPTKKRKDKVKDGSYSRLIVETFANALKHQESVALAAKQVIDDQETLIQYPKMWFKEFRAYNPTTVKTMIQAALKIGLEIQFQINEDSYNGLVLQLQNKDKKCMITFLLTNNNVNGTTNVLEVELSTLSRIRLLHT